MKRFACLLLIALFCNHTAVADLEVHFLDVGQGDAAVILCDGESAMIDGGSADQSSFVFSCLRNTLGLDRIDYLIATHPHEDHIGGLSAALNSCEVEHVLSPVVEHDSEEFQSLVKYTSAQGIGIEMPRSGDVLEIGSARAEIMSAGLFNGNGNDMSLVVRLDYGSTSFLFMGDAEAETEAMLIASGLNVDADVLKVGHHGSDTSSAREFLSDVDPGIAIISVGGENQYDHPSAWVLSDLNMIGSDIYRTDLHGTIIIRSDGEAITVETEKDRPTKTTTNPPAGQQEASEFLYIGNKNSKKLHCAYCESVGDMSEKNKIGFESKEEAINRGYEPCKRCNP